MDGGAGLDLDKAVHAYTDFKARAFSRRSQSLLEDPAQLSKEELQQCGFCCVKEYFPLHDAAELEWLKTTWGTPKVLWNEIMKVRSCSCVDLSSESRSQGVYLREVKAYYGEKVAMYYAFLDFYNRMLVVPSIFGVLTMVGQAFTTVEHNPVSVFYSVAVAAWAVVFLSLWRRREAELAYMWGADDASHRVERVRLEFLKHDLCHKKFNVITKKEEFSYRGGKLQMIRRCRRYAGSFVVLVMVGVVVLGCYVAMYVKVLPDVEIFGSINIVGDVTYANLLGSVTSVAVTIVFGEIFDIWVGPALTNWEGHKTGGSYEEALIIKSFCFQLVNNYFALVFIAFLKNRPVFGQPSECVLMGNPHADDPATIHSCMSELQLQLVVLVAGKGFALQFFHMLLPFLKSKAGFDEGLLSFSLTILAHMENPYS